jgi:hypothetical protein
MLIEQAALAASVAPPQYYSVGQLGMPTSHVRGSSMVFADRLQDKLHFGGNALYESVTDHRHDNAIAATVLRGK